MREYKYILKGHKAIKCPDTIKWAVWYENASVSRVVAQTPIGKRMLSTVFLGLDHNFEGGNKGKPLLFETMLITPVKPRTITRGSTRGLTIRNDYELLGRWGTWMESEKGHRKLLKELKKK